MNKISGIYKITNPNGKIYIGQSHDIDRRFKMYKRLECKGQKYLYASLVKHGYENHSFEILEQCPAEDMNDLEVKYISYYRATDRELGMNLTSGGKNCLDAEETKILKKLNNPRRKEFYAERDGIVQKFDSMNDAEKILGVTRKSIRLSLKNPGIKISKYSYSYEYPTITSHNARIRFSRTEETKNKISLNSGCNKKIYAVFEKEIMEFRSIAEASRQLGDTKKVIGFALRNPSRSKSKYKYFTEYPIMNELNNN